MNAVLPVKRENLPKLVDKAASALSRAKTSAEVLEARQMASFAYDSAKATSRIVKAKEAHDSLLAEIYAVQADALIIEAQAKIRLADEYDAAQRRGEVKRNGGDRSSVEDHNTASAADLGIRREE